MAAAEGPVSGVDCLAAVSISCDFSISCVHLCCISMKLLETCQFLCQSIISS